MNRITITGRLVRDTEIKYTSSDKTLCEFSLAVDRGYKNKDGEREVDFINCNAWGKLGENLNKYQHKGNKILVEGSLRISDYTDDNGKKNYKTYVLANDIEYLDTIKNTKNISDEDLPF